MPKLPTMVGGTYATSKNTVMVCSECGAMVQQYNWGTHQGWHRKLAQAVNR